MAEQKPSVGRIVNVTLDSQSAGDLSRLGGNQYSIGDKVPAVIVRVWSDVCCNLKVFADAPLDFWMTSVTFSPTAAVRSWNWPERV